MKDRTIFIVQPHKTGGTKTCKSTSIYLPAKIVKKLEITTDTFFITKIENEKRIILEPINSEKILHDQLVGKPDHVISRSH